jgi:RES domain-containing protein
MRVYRIAKSQYIRDLTGVGPRTYGGRWNYKGTPMLYTSGSRSLASLEYLVHLPMTQEPLDLSIATLEVPDGLTAPALSVPSLPKNWRTYPAPLKLADIGTRWVRTRESLLLLVPSVVVPDEPNVLINPEHPDIELLELVDVRTYVFDERLLSRIKREA